MAGAGLPGARLLARKRMIADQIMAGLLAAYVPSPDLPWLVDHVSRNRRLSFG